MSANSEKQRRRGRGRPWRPGQSGNPNGRPRIEGEIRELARQYGAEAIGKLVHWMRSADPKFSIAASGELLARGYGRPSQEVLVGPNGVPLQPPNFSISFADGASSQHRKLPDDPVEAARAYNDFMRGIPYDGVECSPTASPPTPQQPAALAAPAAIADVPMTNTAPLSIAAPEPAAAAAAPPRAPVQEPASRVSTKPRAGESVVDAAPHVENGATVWAVDAEPNYPLAIPAGMVPLTPENLKGSG